MKIVFATNNLNKLTEVRKILGNSFEVLSLKDINCNDDIPEKGQTLEDNARQNTSTRSTISTALLMIQVLRWSL